MEHKKMKQTLEDKFFRINPSWLVPNIPLGFDLFIFLPQNKKLINYLKKGTPITYNKLSKFIKNKIASFYCLKEQKKDFNQFIEDVKKDLESRNEEIPNVPTIILSNDFTDANWDREFDLDMIRLKTDKMLEIIKKILDTNKDVTIKNVTEQINNEVRVIRDSLSTIEDEDIYIIEEATNKIKDLLILIKEQEKKLGNNNKITDIFSYYVHLLETITNSPELIDIQKYIVELSKQSDTLKSIINKMGNDEPSLPTSNKLSEKISELSKYVSILNPEDKTEIFKTIDKSHILLNSLLQSHKNNKEIEKINQLIFHHLEAISKYIGITYSENEDHLQILLEMLHYENKLLDGLNEEQKHCIENIFTNTRSLMNKIKNIITAPDEETLSIFNKYKWDINSNIALLIDIRDEKISDLNIKNLISKNIVSITTYIQKAKRELYKNMNKDIETLVLQEPNSELVENEIIFEEKLKQKAEIFEKEDKSKHNYSDTTIKVLKTLLPENKQDDSTNPDEIIAKMKSTIEVQNKEIKKLSHELDMLTFKIEEQDVLQTMIINENIEKTDKTPSTVQLPIKALETENETLKNQVFKLNQKNSEIRTSLIQLINKLKEKEFLNKKYQSEINLLNEKIENITRQTGLLNNGNFKPSTLIEHKMREAEQKLKRINNEYRALMAEHGKLSRLLDEERIRSKRLNIEKINAETIILDLKNELSKNKKVA